MLHAGILPWKLIYLYKKINYDVTTENVQYRPENAKLTQALSEHNFAFQKLLILPLFCCICISLQVTPSNLFTCLLFNLLPSWRVSVTNFLIMSSQPESVWSVEVLANETIMSHKVKFSKRWSTLFEDFIQFLLLRGGGKQRFLKIIFEIKMDTSWYPMYMHQCST